MSSLGGVNDSEAKGFEGIDQPDGLGATGLVIVDGIRELVVGVSQAVQLVEELGVELREPVGHRRAIAMRGVWCSYLAA